MFTVPGIEPPGWKVHLPSPLHLTDFSVRTGSFNLFGLRQPCRHWSSAAAQPIGSALPLVRREGSWNISWISWCAIGGWAASLLFHWFRIRNWGLKILNAVFLKKSQFTIFFFRNKPKSCITKNIYTVQLIIKKIRRGVGAIRFTLTLQILSMRLRYTEAHTKKYRVSTRAYGKARARPSLVP